MKYARELPSQKPYLKNWRFGKYYYNKKPLKDEGKDETRSFFVDNVELFLG
jgi:hypothetical protein